jgi:NAD(P)-dependent dehydrogenase (short-subunit alcohol dehydrogenase family)
LTEPMRSDRLDAGKTSMSRVLITGSSDGLGLMAAKELARSGHEAVLHARNERRAADARAALPGAAVVIGDLSSLEGMLQVATQVNAMGKLDGVIHNAALGYREPRRVVTADGLCQVFAVNVLAPYVLSASIEMPRRLVYLSSGLHRSGRAGLDDLQWERRTWNGLQAYSDSKLFDAVLSSAVARRRPDVLSNALEPGWVATKMGGPSAPDDLALGAKTQVWLVSSEDVEARVSGRYFYHQHPKERHPAVNDHAVQDGLLAICAKLSGVELPMG